VNILSVQVVRGFAGTAKSACSAREGGMITYIKGYLKEQLNYVELLVLGSCFAFGDEPLRSELVLLSLGQSLVDGLRYAESLTVTNS
jgi:hypothetical protein